MGFIWYIIIGIVAGFLAGKVMRGGGFGLIINLLLGILGGVLGGTPTSAGEILQMAVSQKAFFGKKGGITFSG